MSWDALIVGGGVIGLGIAERLAREGLRVLVVEREKAGMRASWSGAGMLGVRPRPGDSQEQRAQHQAILRGIPWYQRHSALWRRETGQDIGFLRTGGIEWLCGVDRAPAASLMRGAVAEGLDAEIWDAAALSAGIPALSPLPREVCAVFYPHEAQVRPPRLVRALRAAFLHLDGHIREHTTIADIGVAGDRVAGVITDVGEEIAARNVVLAAGAWSSGFPRARRFLPRLGDIEPVRGQMVAFEAPLGLLPVTIRRQSRYLLQREDGLLLAGSTQERVGFQDVTTAAGIAGLVEFARELLPPLCETPAAQSWSGLRPGYPSAMPLVGAAAGLQGLFVAAGHFREGFALMPDSAECLCALIIGRASL